MYCGPLILWIFTDETVAALAKSPIFLNYFRSRLYSEGADPGGSRGPLEA